MATHLAENENIIKQAIIRSCQQLHAKNLLAAGDGNVSYRISDKRILMTPSGVAKANISVDDFAIVTLDGDIIKGKPSSEMHMHLKVMQLSPLAKCVIHAHPPVAIAWSIAKPELNELPTNCLSEVILSVKKIPVVPYARPGSKEAGEVLASFMPDYRVMIMARHGALAWGEDIQEAYNGMERLEHSAIILKHAMQLGGITELPQTEINALLDLKKQLGDRTL